MPWCVLCVLVAGNMIYGSNIAEWVVIFEFTYNLVLLAVIFLTIFNTGKFLGLNGIVLEPEATGYRLRGSEKKSNSRKEVLNRFRFT